MKKIIIAISILIAIAVVVLVVWQKKDAQQVQQQVEQSQDVDLIETQNSPEEVVSTFYEWYIKELNVCTGMERIRDCDFDFKNGETERSFVTTNFYENVLSDRDGHSNPIICAQDLPDRMNNSYYQVVDQKQKGHAAVLAHLIYSISGDNQIKVELKQTDNQWRIDNIICLD